MSQSAHPPLRCAILAHVAADWPEFAELRAAARALSQRTRLTNAVSIVSNELRVALAAALLCTDRSALPPLVPSSEDEQHRMDTIQRAVRLYEHARAIVADGAAPMAS